MKKILFILYTCCILSFPVSAQQIPLFKANDRIVFLGNSITEGGHYHSYIWLYYMTHFPNLPLRMYNGGIGGDCVSILYLLIRILIISGLIISVESGIIHPERTDQIGRLFDFNI